MLWYHLLSHFGQEVFQDFLIFLLYIRVKMKSFIVIVGKLPSLQDQLIMGTLGILKFESLREEKKPDLTHKLSAQRHCITITLSQWRFSVEEKNH